MNQYNHRFKTEDLAYWFFRLNGCMCLVNFLIHHERRGQEGTDVDVMAVRFPFRKELALSEHPMDDHTVFSTNGKIDLIIAEVKLGRCNLNGPWTDPDRRNMQRVLYALGAFTEIQIDEVANALYLDHYFEDELYRFRLFAIGQRRNDNLPSRVVQMSWDEISRFIFNRFITYENYKSQHRQWGASGRKLFDQARRYRRDPDEFVQIVINGLMA